METFCVQSTKISAWLYILVYSVSKAGTYAPKETVFSSPAASAIFQVIFFPSTVPPSDTVPSTRETSAGISSVTVNAFSSSAGFRNVTVYVTVSSPFITLFVISAPSSFHTDFTGSSRMGELVTSDRGTSFSELSGIALKHTVPVFFSTSPCAPASTLQRKDTSPLP